MIIHDVLYSKHAIIFYFIFYFKLEVHRREGFFFFFFLLNKKRVSPV